MLPSDQAINETRGSVSSGIIMAPAACVWWRSSEPCGGFVTCHDRSERDPGVSLDLPHQFAPLVSLTFRDFPNRTIQPRLTKRGAPVPRWNMVFTLFQYCSSYSGSFSVIQVQRTKYPFFMTFPPRTLNSIFDELSMAIHQPSTTP